MKSEARGQEQSGFLKGHYTHCYIHTSKCVCTAASPSGRRDKQTSSQRSTGMEDVLV